MPGNDQKNGFADLADDVDSAVPVPVTDLKQAGGGGTIANTKVSKKNAADGQIEINLTSGPATRPARIRVSRTTPRPRNRSRSSWRS